jgi:hypothetical protein
MSPTFPEEEELRALLIALEVFTRLTTERNIMQRISLL